MPVFKGLDTTSNLSEMATELKAQGFDFAIRYYSSNPSKNLSLAEARTLSEARLQIGVVWETAGTDVGFFNRQQGLADGAAACQMAHTAIGQPPGSAIYFAVDYDASSADIDGPVSAYFDGVQAAFEAACGDQAPYQIGVYGSGLVCGTLIGAKRAALGWLSQSTGFAGSKEYASEGRYNLIQTLPTTITLGGAKLSIDPDASNAALPSGLFTL
jgi:hypothetical protein